MAKPKDVWTLLLLSVNLNKASVYVDLSFVNSLQSRTSCAISNPSEARLFKVEESVEYVPDFVFLPPGILRLTNNISPNCLGEPILNSPFESL